MSGDLQSSSDISKVIAEVQAVSSAGLCPLTLEGLADKLELLGSDFGRWNEYKAASVEYVQAFTSEIKWHARIRLGVTVAAALLVIFLSVTLLYCIFHASTLFGSDSGHALTALIAATITGSVVVTISATKGAFATVADRNAGLPMPDHMKELVSVGKSMLSGGSSPI